MLAEPAYYLLINEVSHGPYTAAQIRVLIENQSIQANLNSVSFANAGSSNWQPISEFFALKEHPLNSAPEASCTNGTLLRQILKSKYLILLESPVVRKFWSSLISFYIKGSSIIKVVIATHQRSHTFSLVIAAASLIQVGGCFDFLSFRIRGMVTGVRLDSYPLPDLTGFAYAAASFFSTGWVTPALFFCLVVASLVANKTDPFPITLSPRLRVFSDGLVAARHQVNLVCGWAVRLAIICMSLLTFLWPFSTLIYFLEIESMLRQIFVAAMFGEDSTISKTVEGRRLFAPNELLELLRTRLRDKGIRMNGRTRFRNVSFNLSREENYEEWIFDIEVDSPFSPFSPYGGQRSLFHGYALGECNRRDAWNLDLQERPPNEVPVSRPEK